jgi:hypothetical protein
VNGASDRIDPAVLREMLRGARCAACEQPVDERGHRAIFINQSGQIMRHVICSRCWASSHEEVARRVGLNFTPAKGRA